MLKRNPVLATLAVLALLAAPLVSIAVPQQAVAAPPSISLEVSGEREVVLAGEDREFRLEVSKSDAAGFNLAYVVDVPLGVTFVSSSMGAPTVHAAPIAPAGHERWVWEDVADLPTGASLTMTLVAKPTPPSFTSPTWTNQAGLYPVGSNFEITSSAYVSDTPSLLPVFAGSTGVGGTAATEATEASGAVTTATSVSAIRITKEEPSPESELLRGVHDHHSRYTLLVENNESSRTDAVTVVDYLPAGLEFLGCGDDDNTTVGEEYDGAGSIAGSAVAGCNESDLVEVVTIEKTTPASGSAVPERLAPGVYTRVTWNLGTLAAGESRTIAYAAAVPLYANTMTWPEGAPTGASLEQAANLDNNTGASTRHGDGADVAYSADPETRATDDGDTWTNSARAQGSFPGVVWAADAASADLQRTVADEDDETIHAMDLAVVKSTASGGFSQLGVRSYTLELRTGEYASADDIVLRDTVSNGLCPRVPVGTALVTSDGGAYPAECDPANNPGTVSAGATVDSVTFDRASGEFTTVFSVDSAMAPSSTFGIVYSVLMRSQYEDGVEHGATTSGDSFSNTVDLSGRTSLITPVAAIPGQLAEQDVWDDSGVTIASSLPVIDKDVLARNDVTGGNAPCATGTNWLSGEAGQVPEGFRAGDTACFRLMVDFPDDITTRNAVVSDFLPRDLSYLGSAVRGGLDVQFNDGDAASGRLEWRVGELRADGDRYVAAGATLEILVWARVGADSAATAVDKPQNLMKYRQENVRGDVYFLRDAAAILRDSQPTLVKGVLALNGTVIAGTPNGSEFGSNRDNIQVAETDRVTYRIDLSGNENPITGMEVWDVLPAGIKAADVSAVAVGGVAVPAQDLEIVDNASGLAPASLNGRSVIRVQNVTVPADGTQTITYELRVPSGTSVETSFVNTASVVGFDAGLNTGDGGRVHPEGSVDGSTTPTHTIPALLDTSEVHLPPVTVAKDITASRVEAGNTLSQAVVGELVDYSYSVTVPPRTTVFNGVLSDALPTRLVQYPGFTPTATLNGGALPAGATLAADGTLTLPAVYDNASGQAHVFTVTMRAYPAAGSSAGTTLTNTATFRSTRSESAASPALMRQDTASLGVVAPAPTVAKTVTSVNGVAVSGTPIVRAGDLVTYRLVATNASGRPTSFDSVVADCVPSELQDIAVVSGVATAGTDPDCDGTLMTWTVGAITPGQSATLVYTAQVGPNAVGGVIYTNEATLTGFGLPSSENPSGVRGEHTAETRAQVEVQGATQAKTANKVAATIGESVTYTLTTTLPANVSYYDAHIEDAMPAGLRVDSATVTDAAGLVVEGAYTLPSAGAAATLRWNVSDTGGVGGDIASSATDRTIVIEVVATVVGVGATAAPTANTALNNSAIFRWNTVNGSAASRVGTDTATHEVRVWEPSLAVAKQVNALDETTVAPGEDFDYVISVRNANTATTSTAYDVVVVDTVPSGVVVDESTITPAASEVVKVGGVVTRIEWTIPSIAKNADAKLSYSARLAASDTLRTDDRLRNVAEATEYFSLPSTSSADRREYAGPSADAVVEPEFPVLGVSKTAAAGPAYLGARHGFTVVVTNTGDGVARGVTVNDVLPEDWSYLAGSATIGGTATADPTIVGQALTWVLAADLPAGGSVTLAYSAVPSSNAATGSASPHVNTVTVTASDASSAPGNDTGTYRASDDASVEIHRADLAIEKTSSGSAVAGTNHTWTIEVGNEGPDPAVGPIVVTDTLPAGTSFVSASGTGWTVSGPAAGAYTFTHAGPVPANGTLPAITLVASIGAAVEHGTDVTNGATVSGRTHETVTSNNQDSDTITVSAVADVALVKTIDATTFVAGEDAVWNIAVTNHGPSVSVGPITVTDTLPAGIGEAVAAGTDWTCGVPSGGEIECVYAGDLAVGQTAPAITVTTPVLSSTTGTLVNEATVVPTTSEPAVQVHSNTDDATTGPVGARADLRIEKDLSSNDLVAGETASYEIEVTNDGPSDALNVTVRDTLPAGLTFVPSSVSNTDWACAVDANNPALVDCTLAAGSGTLAAGESTSFEFDVLVASSVFGGVTNTAEVSSTTTDPDSSNNLDAVTTVPTLKADVTVDKATTATVTQGGETIEYTLQVSNEGVSDAAAVTLRDELPSTLRYVSSATAAPAAGAAAWGIPTVTGQDPDGLGGTIEWTLLGTLPAGADAPLVTVVTEVVAEAGSDGTINAIPNEGEVSWTDLDGLNPGTDDDRVDTPLRWISYDGRTSCIADAAWFDYDISTSANVDTTVHDVTISWYKDANGNGIPEDPASIESDPVVDDPAAAPVAVYTIAAGGATLTTDDGRSFPVTVDATSGRVLSGSMLWPGAQVDEHGVAVAWPGYRVALAGEAATWENLVYDETLPGANLRAGALVKVSANPETSFSAVYPATPPACEADRSPKLSLAKTASVTAAGAGERFSYTLAVTNVSYGAASAVTLKDAIPADVAVLAVKPATPASAEIPAWQACELTGQDGAGFGGTVTCVLGGLLGYGQGAPAVVLDVQVSSDSKGQPIVNRAEVSWGDPDGDVLAGTAYASATINAGWLPWTGPGNVLGALLLTALLLLLGGILLMVRRVKARRS